MTAAMACYVLNDTCVKLTTHSLAAGQVLALRGIAATIMVAAMALRSARREDLHAILRPVVALRCGLEITTAALSVAALSLASLGLVTAVTMAAPVMIGLGAVAMGWEPVRGRRVAAVLAGFAGVLLVVRPSAGGEGAWGAGFALLCAASLAARDLVTRRLPRDIPSTVIALLTTASVALAGLALSLAQAWRPLHGPEALLILAAALFAALGNYAVLAACRDTDLSVVTPFRYANILWALLLGYLVWGEVPDSFAVAGIGLIAASGIASMRASRGG
jgi:drug/metabolite transporter (DMT)-like permease